MNHSLTLAFFAVLCFSLSLVSMDEERPGGIKRQRENDDYGERRSLARLQEEDDQEPVRNPILFRCSDLVTQSNVSTGRTLGSLLMQVLIGRYNRALNEQLAMQPLPDQDLVQQLQERGIPLCLNYTYQWQAQLHLESLLDCPVAFDVRKPDDYTSEVVIGPFAGHGIVWPAQQDDVTVDVTDNNLFLWLASEFGYTGGISTSIKIRGMPVINWWAHEMATPAPHWEHLQGSIERRDSQVTASFFIQE